MAKLTIIENDNHSICHRTSTVEFVEKDGIKYCNNCGRECLIENVCCPDCGKNNFLSEKISSVFSGYIKLVKKNVIKRYYCMYFNFNSVVKMNSKRMIHQLMQHKNKIEIQKEIVDKIYNANVIKMEINE